ncbi:hypothetical protein PR048_011395 [Dryococelus australis]|uniref:Reverse transcriptase RNase H-like domain-containing protein n=1 Tax=Dryococelus australis TaxID=614101 RepID=A0ABQ9HLG7_9NEOP|nr:hypothetical protein PR048_011395 [Dryococelus australis]
MQDYFSRFIENCAELCAPFSKLRKKDVPFISTELQEKAFGDLKYAISLPPPLILALTDFSKQFVLQVDASALALGGVLLQDSCQGLKPIAFTSHTLNNNEQHLSSFEKEVLACVWGVEKFATHVEYQVFELHTDSQALTWFYSHPKQVGKIRCWIAKLNNCMCNFVHIKGKDDVIADCLSQLYENSEFENGRTFLRQFRRTNSAVFRLAQCPKCLPIFISGKEFVDIKEQVAREYNSMFRVDQDLIFFCRSLQKEKILSLKVRDLTLKYFHSSARGRHIGKKGRLRP